jgi:hypothetical protein
MMCPVCEFGTLKPTTWSAVFGGVTVNGLEGYICDHCDSDPIYTAQIRRNEKRIAEARSAADTEAK